MIFPYGEGWNRYCVWIVGHADTLAAREGTWSYLIRDSRRRGCYMDARDEQGMADSYKHLLNRMRVSDFPGDAQGRADPHTAVILTKRDLQRPFSRCGKEPCDISAKRSRDCVENRNGQPEGECSLSNHRKKCHIAPINECILPAEQMPEEGAQLRSNVPTDEETFDDVKGST